MICLLDFRISLLLSWYVCSPQRAKSLPRWVLSMTEPKLGYNNGGKKSIIHRWQTKSTWNFSGDCVAQTLIWMVEDKVAELSSCWLSELNLLYSVWLFYFSEKSKAEANVKNCHSRQFQLLSTIIDNEVKTFKRIWTHALICKDIITSVFCQMRNPFFYFFLKKKPNLAETMACIELCETIAICSLIDFLPSQ